MPRVKSDTTVTHRIEFSPVERNLLAEAMLEHRKSIPFKRAKEISSSFGGFAAPVAVGVAAYAFWRWAGLGSIVERAKSGFESFSEDLVTNTIGFVGDITGAQETLNEAVSRIGQLIQNKKDECQARVEYYDEIINNPNTSENVKRQAEQDRLTTIEKCSRTIAKMNRILKDKMKVN
jgi:hypothetical protein